MLNPKNMRFLPFEGSDTRFEADMQAKGFDGKVEGYITDFTLEFNFPKQFMLLHGVGLDNAL
jgi:hypothetical protein